MWPIKTTLDLLSPGPILYQQPLRGHSSSRDRLLTQPLLGLVLSVVSLSVNLVSLPASVFHYSRKRSPSQSGWGWPIPCQLDLDWSNTPPPPLHPSASWSLIKEACALCSWSQTFCNLNLWHVQKQKWYDLFWNNFNLSLVTEFCINKEGLWLLVRQAARFLQSSGLAHPSLPTPYLLSVTWTSPGLTKRH